MNIFNKRTLALTACVTVTGLLSAPSVLGGDTHYRWLNERGEPVYSDVPPTEGIDYEVVSSSSTLKRQVSADEGAVPPETEPSVDNPFEAIDTAARDEIQTNPVRCEGARKDLEALTGETRIFVQDANGDRRELTAEEIELRTETTRARIKVFCKEGDQTP